MEDDAPVIYGGLEFQARALAPQVAEPDAIRFFVGTQSLKGENQVHQIDFDEENNHINKNVFYHKEGEVWQISASTVDKDVMATCFNQTSECKAEMKAAIWRIANTFDSPVVEDGSGGCSLEKLTCFDNLNAGDIRSILWHPIGESTNVICIGEESFHLCDLEESSTVVKQISSGAIGGKSKSKFTCGRWNPHHNCMQFASANDTTVRGWDLRTMTQAWTIENAHGQLVRDLNFNPNKQYYLASCGDDCKAKFWDIRKTSEPVKVLSDHSHWVWSIRYNSFHDQLVLTSSSDSRVILTNTTSISSEPFGNNITADDDDEENDDSYGFEDSMKENANEPMKDGLIMKYEHEESVYAAEWSSSEPWIFASLSYDGRLVINRVLRSVKYQILL